MISGIRETACKAKQNNTPAAIWRSPTQIACKSSADVIAGSKHKWLNADPRVVNGTPDDKMVLRTENLVKNTVNARL